MPKLRTGCEVVVPNVDCEDAAAEPKMAADGAAVDPKPPNEAVVAVAWEEEPLRPLPSPEENCSAVPDEPPKTEAVGAGEEEEEEAEGAAAAPKMGLKFCRGLASEAEPAEEEVDGTLNMGLKPEGSREELEELEVLDGRLNRLGAGAGGCEEVLVEGAGAAGRLNRLGAGAGG